MIKYPEVEVQLIGNDGNAYAIMGAVRRALKRARVSADEIDEYVKQSMSGDYDNLLRVAMSWVTVL
jgi:TolB-like protein